MPVDCFPNAPTEWRRAVFAHFAEVNPSYRLDNDTEYPFVEMASVGENFRGISKFDRRKLEGSGFARFKRSDILFAKITPSPENGKVALVKQLPEEFGIGSTEFIVLSPRNDNDPRYIFALACSNPVKGRAVSRMEGSTGRLRVTEDTFKKWLVVAVPDPSEQKKIADILEKCESSRLAAEDKLASAITFKSGLMQQLFSRGFPGRNISFKQTKIGEIPNSWDVTSIGAVLDGSPFSGVSPQSRQSPPGTPILNVECIDDGLCTTEHVTFVDVDEKTLRECRAVQGDFYVLRGNGNREYVATGGLLRQEPTLPTIFSDKLIRLRFKHTEVAERFIPYLWQSGGFLRRLQSKAESGSGLWMMSKRDIRKELFAKPRCLDEQREIVALIDTAVDNIAACHAEVIATERMMTSLSQNLLTGKVRVRV
jgi:type I restriction enzyme S subunit